MNSLPEILSWSDVTFLPIVSAYVKKIGIVEEIDRLCNMESDVRPGHVVSLMIMDTLSGRSSPYRLENSDAHDRQKIKKLTKEIAEEHKNLTKLKVREEKIRYACGPDVGSAAGRIAQALP